MVKKGAFTLIEIIITLVIIGFVLAMVASLSQGFSSKVRFDNTKETILSTMQNAVQEAATTNTVTIGSGHIAYGNMTITLASGSIIQQSFASGDMTTGFIRKTPITYGAITTSGFRLTLTPYTLGCAITSGATFKVVSTETKQLQACYSADPATCKVREVTCP